MQCLDRFTLGGVQPVKIGRRPPHHGALRQWHSRLHGVVFAKIIHAAQHSDINRGVKPLFTLCSANQPTCKQHRPAPIKAGMSLHNRYPAIADLKSRAAKRIPHFVWEYLDSATGVEATQARNRAALDQVLFNPSILHGEFTPDLSTALMGREYPLPIGIAPVGMSGLIWPNAEQLLARTAARAGIPYTISTVATQTPKDVATHIGDQGWFQIYPPRDAGIRADMLKQARDIV